VGLFVLSGIALAIAVVLAVGGSDWFRRPVVYETYFEESVQGLEVGSPVKLRGVKLGTVSEIRFVGDVYDLEGVDDQLEYGRRVLVRMELEPADEEVSREELRRRLSYVIDQGLRVRLTPLGITGTAFLQADLLDPAKYPPMEIAWEPEHPYVPSAPSTITQLSSAAERIFERIEELDLEALLRHLDELLVTANQMAAKVDLAELQGSLETLLEDARSTSATLRGSVRDADMPAVTADARAALERLVGALERVEQLVEGSRSDLDATLENLRVATANLRDVTETARDYPSLLLLGEPPRPARVGP
jgi:ABC-type transporter Mla subunit MlaD